MTAYEHVSVCPTCGSEHELASSPDGGAPVDGDVSLCWGCRCFAVFDASSPGGVRKPTPGEQAEITADAGVQRMSAAVAVHATPSEAVKAVQP